MGQFFRGQIFFKYRRIINHWNKKKDKYDVYITYVKKGKKYV